MFICSSTRVASVLELDAWALDVCVAAVFNEASLSASSLEETRARYARSRSGSIAGVAEWMSWKKRC